MTAYASTTDILEDATRSDLHDLITFLENTPDEVIFPEKYKLGLEHSVSQKIEALFSQQPHISLNKAVAEVVNCLPEGLSSELLLEMTRFAIGEFESFIPMRRLECA